MGAISREMSSVQRVLDRITRVVSVVSPTLAAGIDWLRPSLHSNWGGPMNGQNGRRAIMRELAGYLKPSAVIETGTFRGDSTAFLADISGSPVYSIESSKRYYLFARWRLQRQDVHLFYGDSREFLKTVEIADNSILLIYLDAHWERDLPLPNELAIISRRWPQAVVVIDDFEVPDDAGYAFDDYGSGAALREEILPTEMESWCRLYPRLPSSDETGAHRGCVVLASSEWDTSELSASCGLRLVGGRSNGGMH